MFSETVGVGRGAVSGSKPKQQQQQQQQQQQHKQQQPQTGGADSSELAQRSKEYEGVSGSCGGVSLVAAGGGV